MSEHKYQYTDFPALSTEELAERYDTQAPTYNASLVFVDRWLGVRALRRQLFGRARGDVLDVACGTGENLRYLPRDQVSSMTATDLSPGMLAVARHELSKLGLAVTFHQMDAQDLKFPDAHFDTVISSLATCTFPDPIKALHEMARVCKPDGRILLVEHGRSRVRWLASLQDRWAHGQYASHGCRWNQDVQALMKASGLRIIESRTRLLGILHAIEAAPPLV